MRVSLTSVADTCGRPRKPQVSGGVSAPRLAKPAPLIVSAVAQPTPIAFGKTESNLTTETRICGKSM